jgi:hypothetical protein
VNDAIASLASLLTRAGVPYALIGGHAVNVWLEPRFTADVDVTVQANAADLTRLRAVLGAAGYTIAREHGGDLPSGPDFVRFVSSASSVTLEVQAAKTEFQREVIRRATSVGGTVRVATPEDLIVMKLIANRAKDRADLEGLVRLPAVDWDYVERWAGEWGVLEQLGRLRAPRP